MYQPTIDATAWTLLAPAKPVRGSHIVVLTHAQPAPERISALLSGHPSLACTAGTGILQLCEQAAGTWRVAERTGSSLSTLAAASVRAMTGSLISVIRSQEGRERWCEISTAPARSARMFLAIYPQTQIVCLHRNCADVVRALGRGRRGRDGEPVEAAAARWRKRTESLLALEDDYAGQCLRLRYEDLVTTPAAAAGLLSFLGLDRRAVPAPDAAAVVAADAGAAAGAMGSPDGRGQDAALTSELVGPSLLERINRLHAELRYPSLGQVRTGG